MESSGATAGCWTVGCLLVTAFFLYSLRKKTTKKSAHQDTRDESASVVTTHTAVVGNHTKIFIAALIVAAGVGSRLVYVPLSSPSAPVFDEVHVGRFINRYWAGEYFFDVHPPLSKLLYLGASHALGYNPLQCSYSEPQKAQPKKKKKKKKSKEARRRAVEAMKKEPGGGSTAAEREELQSIMDVTVETCPMWQLRAVRPIFSFTV